MHRRMPRSRISQDVYDHTLRVLDLIESQRELLTGLLEGQLAMQSNQMNRVMKATSSWGAILIASTLIAGIYGMNFEHMPELEWYSAIPFALALMGLVTIVLYRVFKRQRLAVAARRPASPRGSATRAAGPRSGRGRRRCATIHAISSSATATAAMHRPDDDRVRRWELQRVERRAGPGQRQDEQERPTIDAEQQRRGTA